MAGVATVDHMAAAAVYQHNVVQARAAAGMLLISTCYLCLTIEGGGHHAAPAWFMPAMQAALQPLEDIVEVMGNHLDLLTDVVYQTARTSAFVSSSLF